MVKSKSKVSAHGDSASITASRKKNLKSTKLSMKPPFSGARLSAPLGPAGRISLRKAKKIARLRLSNTQGPSVGMAKSVKLAKKAAVLGADRVVMAPNVAKKTSSRSDSRISSHSRSSNDELIGKLLGFKVKQTSQCSSTDLQLDGSTPLK